jgi:hypothetical protein
MRHWVLALVTAAVLAAPAAAQTEWANKLFEETSKDFGTCPRGAQLKHSFKMTNIYKVPLEVTDVTPKCNCVTCTLTHKVLQPNESAGRPAVRFDGHADREGGVAPGRDVQSRFGELRRRQPRANADADH